MLEGKDWAEIASSIIGSVWIPCRSSEYPLVYGVRMHTERDAQTAAACLITHRSLSLFSSRSVTQNNVTRPFA